MDSSKIICGAFSDALRSREENKHQKRSKINTSFFDFIKISKHSASLCYPGKNDPQLPELQALLEEKRATTIGGALPISGQILENIRRSRALRDISRVLHVTHCYLVKSEILKDYTFPPSDPDKTVVEDSIWFSNQLRKKVENIPLKVLHYF